MTRGGCPYCLVGGYGSGGWFARCQDFGPLMWVGPGPQNMRHLIKNKSETQKNSEVTLGCNFHVEFLGCCTHSPAERRCLLLFPGIARLLKPLSSRHEFRPEIWIGSGKEIPGCHCKLHIHETIPEVITEDFDHEYINPPRFTLILDGVLHFFRAIVNVCFKTHYKNIPIYKVLCPTDSAVRVRTGPGALSFSGLRMPAISCYHSDGVRCGGGSTRRIVFRSSSSVIGRRGSWGSGGCLRLGLLFLCAGVGFAGTWLHPICGPFAPSLCLLSMLVSGPGTGGPAPFVVLLLLPFIGAGSVYAPNGMVGWDAPLCHGIRFVSGQESFYCVTVLCIDVRPGLITTIPLILWLAVAGEIGFPGVFG